MCSLCTFFFFRNWQRAFGENDQKWSLGMGLVLTNRMWYGECFSVWSRICWFWTIFMADSNRAICESSGWFGLHVDAEVKKAYTAHEQINGETTLHKSKCRYIASFCFSRMCPWERWVLTVSNCFPRFQSQCNLRSTALFLPNKLLVEVQAFSLESRNLEYLAFSVCRF